MNTRTCLVFASMALCLLSLPTAGEPLAVRGDSGVTDAGPTIRLLMRADDMGNSFGRTLGNGKEDREFFFNALGALKPGKWIGVVHPGTGEPQRASVVELLCSQRTKEIIKSKNLQLVSYNDLWNEVYGQAASR